jgi:hypothetical protein
MTEINLRKTLARFVYFIEQTNSGKSKESILKELELTETEFQFLLSRALDISTLTDNEAKIVTPVEEHKYLIGGCLLSKNNKTLMSL